MVATITINIPDEIYQRLALNAQATQRSIEDILAHVLKVGSPPDWSDVPEEFQADLRDLDGLSDADLQQIAVAQKTEAELERYDDLLDRNVDGTLSIAEQTELHNLRQASDCFMLKKAQATVLLRWRGYQM